MKIKVVEQTIKEGGYDRVTHKYFPLKYCCDKLKHTKYIELTDELMSFCSICDVEDRYDCSDDCDLYKDGKHINLSFCYEDTHPEPWEDYYATDTYYIPLDYCPFCGEKIEVEVIKKEDITEEYLEAEKKYEEIHKKWMKCDSIKRRSVLEEEWRTWSDKMDEMMRFGEYKNE